MESRQTASQDQPGTCRVRQSPVARKGQGRATPGACRSLKTQVLHARPTRRQARAPGLELMKHGVGLALEPLGCRPNPTASAPRHHPRGFSLITRGRATAQGHTHYALLTPVLQMSKPSHRGCLSRATQLRSAPGHVHFRVQAHMPAPHRPRGRRSFPKERGSSYQMRILSCCIPLMTWFLFLSPRARPALPPQIGLASMAWISGVQIHPESRAGGPDPGQHRACLGHAGPGPGPGLGFLDQPTGGKDGKGRALQAPVPAMPCPQALVAEASFRLGR